MSGFCAQNDKMIVFLFLLLQNVASHPCNIQRVDYNELNQSEFSKLYYQKIPVILYNMPSQTNSFTKSISRLALRKSQTSVIVGTASHRFSQNDDDSDMRGKQTISSYLKALEILARQKSQKKKKKKKSLNCASVFDKTFFSSRPIIASKFQHNPILPRLNTSSLILSIGGESSGLTFHQHGDSYLYLLQGQKQWFLYSENSHQGGVPGGFRDDTCGSEWKKNVLPGLEQNQKPMQCVQEAGEVMYVPHAWWHATVNLKKFNIAVVEQNDFPNYLSELPENSAHRRHVVGEQLIEKGDLESAHTLYIEGVKQHPKYHPMWNNLGAIILMKDGISNDSVDQAMEAFFTSTQVNPLYQRGWLALGRVLMGDTGGGVAVGDTTLEKQKGGVTALKRAAALSSFQEEKDSLLLSIREIEKDIEREEKRGDVDLSGLSNDL